MLNNDVEVEDEIIFFFDYPNFHIDKKLFKSVEEISELKDILSHLWAKSKHDVSD